MRRPAAVKLFEVYLHFVGIGSPPYDYESRLHNSKTRFPKISMAVKNLP
jgi:hypothetical protein